MTEIHLDKQDIIILLSLNFIKYRILYELESQKNFIAY